MIIPAELFAIGSSQISLPVIEEAMLKRGDKIEIQEHHIFSAGVYIRQIEIPTGTLVMGKRHRCETCNVLLSGTLEMISEDGTVKTISGPYVFTSPAFTKKLAYCTETAIFMNIIPTEEMDPVSIENKVIIPENEYLQLQGVKEVPQCHS